MALGFDQKRHENWYLKQTMDIDNYGVRSKRSGGACRHYHPKRRAGEPEIETVQQAAALARQEGCELVIGFGGGSALDTGKALAAMLTNKGGLLDYLEVIGLGKALSQPSAPFIAIPTTAGTGSEVT